MSGSLNAKDLAGGAVTNGKLAANSVDGSKVADGSLTGADVLDGSLTGADVQADSLTGVQVNESTLGEVPLAKIGGLGRSTGGVECEPAGTAFVDCVILTLDLPSASRVLLIGQATAEASSDHSSGHCKLVTQFGDVAGTSEFIALLGTGDSDSFSLSGVTAVLGPGSVDFAVDCNNEMNGIYYYNVGLTALAISPD
jgi:hypothetical protein